MKRLSVFVNEAIIKKLKEPVKGKTAYDYNDEKWKIVDWCHGDDENKLNSILKNYDDSGAMKDFIDDMGLDDEDIVVGAEGDLGVAAFIWGPEGLYYKK